MFINIPNNYSSMWGELNFEYNSTSSDEVVVKVKDAVTGKSFGVKKFYSTTSAKINIAPLLFDSLFPAPQGGDRELVTTPTKGFAQVEVECNGDVSQKLIFTYGRERVEPPILLTTMSLERILYCGESDELAIIAPVGSAVNYSLRCYDGDGCELSAEEQEVCSDEGGVRIFTICADHYIDDCEVVKIAFSCDEVEFAAVAYTLQREPSQGCRIAWLSSAGSIEHYTFPLIVERKRLSTAATTMLLRSAYGREQELEALSEIVSSPRVWIKMGKDAHYKEVEVQTKEQYIRRDGALMIANIEIQEND